MKKIIFIISIVLILFPNISFGVVNITEIQKQIQSILIQIQEIQRLLNNLQRSQDIQIFNMPKKEIKKEEVNPQIPEKKEKEEKEVKPRVPGQGVPAVSA